MTTQPAVISTFVKYYRHYGWHTYTSWTTKYPPSPHAALPPVWTAMSVTAEPAGSRALSVSVTCANAGTVSVAYGRRSGAYSMNTPPVPVQAGVATTIRLTDLRPATNYYICPVWDGIIPNPAGLPLSGNYQNGEMLRATL